MKELHKTSFWESLIIQKRVIGALLMREIITRYGRNNIGFLWLFVEPLLMTLIMVLMWKFFKVNNISTLNIVAFTITGYPMMMMWRNASNRAIGSISANMSLLYHRNVRVLDTIFARMLLEIAGATIAQIAIMSVLTLAVLAIIIFLSRHELVKAWNLFLHADLWLLFLLLPFQIIVYFAGGEMIFSYLREKNLIITFYIDLLLTTKRKHIPHSIFQSSLKQRRD